ncbi:RDD family protein [Bacteroides oleiciplenus]|uniref:RDD domain-containing protein n=1 Tax=Bacteroides oleiciplenus TaxID=626931 RepID=A0A3E5BP46_9BACE|nr:RDD family protein [Bacteroides oleiciplenus]RGN39412.1 hypothetical protein DXB65_03535 [Bacteroides oleiciplenus]
MNIRLKRFMAFFIDVVIAALLAILVNSILVLFNMRVITPMVAIFGWFILICKDCFRGASFGRRIIGIQVVDTDTRQIASPLKCVVRNLFYFLTFIEFIVMHYSSNGLRLGDYAAHTQVALYNKTLRSPKFLQSISAIGYVLIGLILFEIFFYCRASSLGLWGLLYQ